MLGVLLAAACGESFADDGLLRIEDQSGAEFFWTAEEKVHRIVGVSPPLPECSSDDYRPDYTYGWNRFVDVFAMCWAVDGTGGSGRSDWGRYLICDDDGDCPQLTRFDHFYECRAGFCQSIDLEAYPPGLPNSIDMEMLCRGDAPRYEEEAFPDSPTALDLEVEAACPNEDRFAACTSVPDGCFDPR